MSRPCFLTSWSTRVLISGGAKGRHGIAEMAFFAAVPQSATACLIRSKLAASALSCGKSLATESTVNVTFIFFVVRSQLAAYVYVIGSLLVSFAVLTRLAVSVASFWEEHATFSSASFAWPVRVFM